MSDQDPSTASGGSSATSRPISMSLTVAIDADLRNDSVSTRWISSILS